MVLARGAEGWQKMGMYDTIEVQYPLPEPKPKEKDFQSKEFECNLDKYLLDSDGKLWLLEYGLRDDDSQPSRPLRIEYHGWVRFYTSEGSTRQPDYRWFEYRAKFTDGACVGIEAIVEEQPIRPAMAAYAPVKRRKMIGKIEETKERTPELPPVPEWVFLGADYGDPYWYGFTEAERSSIKALDSFDVVHRIRLTQPDYEAIAREISLVNSLDVKRIEAILRERL